MATVYDSDTSCEEKRLGDTVAGVGFDGQTLPKALAVTLWSSGAPSAGSGLEDGSNFKAGVLAKDDVGVLWEGSVYNRCGCSLRRAICVPSSF
jgi:hypothetical protein